MKFSSVSRVHVRVFLVLFVFAILTIAGCGSDDDEQLPGPRTGAPPLAGPPYGSDGLEYKIRMDVEHKTEPDQKKQDAAKPAN